MMKPEREDHETLLVDELSRTLKEQDGDAFPPSEDRTGTPVGE